jgi:hypothetical protein
MTPDDYFNDLKDQITSKSRDFSLARKNQQKLKDIMVTHLEKTCFEGIMMLQRFKIHCILVLGVHFGSPFWESQNN